MAKVLFGGGIADMRRSLEGNTFSRNKGGSYVRQKVRPTNPQTPDQIQKREILSQLSKFWGDTLTEAQRDGWTAFAEINTIVDVLGQVLQLSGIQMYIRINTRLQIAGQTRIDDAPLTQAVQQIEVGSVSFTKGAPTIFQIEFAPDLPSGQGLQIFSTPGLSPGISFIKNRTRLITPYIDAAATPVDVIVDWNTKFGTDPADGAKIVVLARVLNSLNGATSVPVRGQAFVV